MSTAPSWSRRLLTAHWRRRAGAAALVLASLGVGAVPAAEAESPGISQDGGPSAHEKTGTVRRVSVHSRALTGNLEGDSPDREVSIYLPPGYRADRSTRYPVLYMLHGFTETDLSYFASDARTNIPASADRTLAAGTSRKMIIVTPNAMTVRKGSNYSSGATTGDWETFVSNELVSYVDTHYRTIRDRRARGLAGHSMGGYGTLRIGMKHPDVFSSLYILSSCCIDQNSNIPDTPEEIAAMQNFTAHPENYPDGPPSGIATAVAAAASWAPNPSKPPLYFDSPFVDGRLDPQVFARMTANRPLAMVDQYLGNLRQQNISFDVGDADKNIAANLTRLDAVLTGYGVKHSFEVYEGDHTNRIPERFENKVLPYFSKVLTPAGDRR
ncbi:esterase [Actinomadura sp. LD22]|uniref:Esterase n=1 Tax=Actinomadura physcomitrii TaxID=2650748 RepID=A0A6I4MG81_9ACTN|nr:alpha/beta hydrolase-fold protein [Actinomadura physcomitrii]MWA04782.1 esterase [Actinomadura physcomitrii]